MCCLAPAALQILQGFGRKVSNPNIAFPSPRESLEDGLHWCSSYGHCDDLEQMRELCKQMHQLDPMSVSDSYHSYDSLCASCCSGYGPGDSRYERFLKDSW